MEIKNVMVIGAGTMGNGIAHVFALFGYHVTLCDIKQEFIDRGMKTIELNLDRQVKKGSLSDDQKKNTLSNIYTSIDIVSASKGKDLIIEAATENLEIKLKIFKTLDENADTHTVLASNTSSISITEIGAVTKRPAQVIGMHFMNPVPVMKLVEIIRGYSTSQETFDLVKMTSEKLDKIPVEVNDYPGFVSNRVLMPMINEAIFCVYEGVATPEAVDTVMKLGMAHPMGPLQLADFIGLDVCLAILNVLYEGFNDSKYRPCPLLKKMVTAGHLGKKSGQGFYKY